MNLTYTCPHCRSVLNPETSIVVRAEHDGRRFLLGLHPQPGNYDTEVPAGEVLTPGTRCDLSCPVCDHGLGSDLSDDLCALDLCCDDDRHRVYFSRIVGEQATFVVSAEGLLTDHGIHTDRYLEHLVHRKYMR